MKLTLIRKKIEVPGVESFIFEPAEPIDWKAGQYLHYVLHHEPTDDRGSDRWFTIASAPYEKEIMLTTKIATSKGSSFKSALVDLKMGETIEISYLGGDFVLGDYSKEYVFIAGGIGITPFYSILKDLDEKKVQIKATLLYANHDENIPYKEDLEHFVKNNSNLTIHYVLSPEHIDEDLIKKLVPDLQKPMFYISGPEQMVESLGDTLDEMDIHTDRVKQDYFPGYDSE